jgi:hypothetical protein
MNELQLTAPRSQAPATDEGRAKSSWPAVVRRAAVRAARTVGRGLASTPALWWLGLPWQSQRPPTSRKSGG